MKNIYLVSFDYTQTDISQVKSALDKSKFVHDWLFFLPGSLALKFDGPKRELYWLLRKEMSGSPFIISEIDPDGATGVAPGPFWDFVYSDKPISA